MTDETSGIVPRETVETLQAFAALVARWNRRINLVSRSEVADLWFRHILDSAQLMSLAPANAQTWVDLGSGAGFPGVVCALIAKAQGRTIEFTLLEADARKAAFLREASRRFALNASVVNARVEQATLRSQDVISARALAPLPTLIEYGQPFCHGGTRLLFPKGRQVDSELTLARRDWHIRVVRVPSRTDPEGTILQISEVMRRE